eukprot:363309-Chlamydomonas_euryale.AAC.15
MTTFNERGSRLERAGPSAKGCHPPASRALSVSCVCQSAPHSRRPRLPPPPLVLAHNCSDTVWPIATPSSPRLALGSCAP